MHWHAVACSCERDEGLAGVAGTQYVPQAQAISDLYEKISDLPIRIKTMQNKVKLTSILLYAYKLYNDC